MRYEVIGANREYGMVRMIAGIVVTLLFFGGSVSAQGRITNPKQIWGAWVNRENFYYTFDADGVMRARKSDPVSPTDDSYRYEMFIMQDYEFIRYAENLTDSTGVHFLMVCDVMDSTALFAYGVPFMKADDTEGFPGRWVRVNDLSVITWVFGVDEIEYHHDILDLFTGEFFAFEDRRGTYRYFSRGFNAGRYYIDFEDGEKAVVVPILFKKIMYLFDLSPRRTLFKSTDRVP